MLEVCRTRCRDVPLSDVASVGGGCDVRVDRQSKVVYTKAGDVQSVCCSDLYLDAFKKKG
jgi:hypothetical protein